MKNLFLAFMASRVAAAIDAQREPSPSNGQADFVISDPNRTLFLTTSRDGPVIRDIRKTGNEHPHSERGARGKFQTESRS